jgi:hypothetical protein
MSGWSNYSGKVISYKMNENEMGYRGSKSKFNKKPNQIKKLNFVKEQRVDGSWFLNKLAVPKLFRNLRFTLMGFESSYQIKIPSKQLKGLYFSTISCKHNKLNPSFVSGLIDAEGCFCTTIYKAKNLKTGWRVLSYFEIGLNKKDSILLYQLQEFFGGIGSIRLDNKANALKFSVANINDLKNIIIPHFKKYPLLTQKAADLILFEQIVELMSTGAHLTNNGIQKIVNIKYYMNLGISNLIRLKFNNIKPVQRPIINTTNIYDSHWLSGFVSGDGNFDAGVRPSKNIIGYTIYLRFRITQHIKDTKLLKLIIKFLGAGRIETDNKGSVENLVIGNLTDLNQIIIPFFNKYSLGGTKHLDYQDWCKIANLINEGKHLTMEGIEQINYIKSGMNKGRKNI